MTDKDAELREQLFGYAEQCRVESREIDGKTWYFREMDTKTADEFLPISQALAEGRPIPGSFRAKLLRMTLCNEKGMLLYTEKQEGQIARVPSRLSKQLVDAAMEISGMISDEEAEKN